MLRHSGNWIALLVGISTLFPTGCRASHSHDLSSNYNVQAKVLLRAPGTIVRVKQKPHGEQSYDLFPGPEVCFIINSFSAIPDAVRPSYASAERARLAVNGPRCRDTSIDQSAVHIKVGDPVDVYYTLENSGQIAIVSVYTQGLEL
jgi:hypothetical protein